MSQPLDLFILAGEPSGDRIGADLVRRLRQRVELTLSGVGGSDLAAEGLTTLYFMSDLAVMGITDVLARLPLLLWRVEQTARFILRRQPDITVLIDSQEFVKLVATRLRKQGFRRPILLYVAPSVWARAPHRAKKLVPFFDEVLTVLPFEPEVLHELGGPPSSYVGHPALAEIQPPANLAEGRIALLPGSRLGEIRRHLPVMREAAKALSQQPQVTGFYIPTLPSLTDTLRAEIRDWPVPVEILADRQSRADLYAETLLAISVAGTATLELALANVPMLITYVMDAHQARAFEKLGRPIVGLPNIVLGRQLVPEFVTARPDPDAVRAAALDLLANEKARAAQQAGFNDIAMRMLEGDPGHPRQDPADRVLAHWRQREPIAT